MRELTLYIRRENGKFLVCGLWLSLFFTKICINCRKRSVFQWAYFMRYCHNWVKHTCFWARARTHTQHTPPSRPYSIMIWYRIGADKNFIYFNSFFEPPLFSTTHTLASHPVRMVWLSLVAGYRRTTINKCLPFSVFFVCRVLFSWVWRVRYMDAVLSQHSGWLKVTVFKSCCIIFYVKYYNSPPAERQVYENMKIYFDKFIYIYTANKREKEYVCKAPTYTTYGLFHCLEYSWI